MGYEEPHMPPCLPQEYEPVEYRVFRLDLDDPTDTANSLNSIGKEGWILCHLDHDRAFAVFYRPTKGERFDTTCVESAKKQAKKIKSLVSLQARTTKATGRSRQVFKKRRS